MYFRMGLQNCVQTNPAGGGVIVPNIKSAKKRVLTARAASEQNKAARSALKTTLKKFDAAVAAGDAAKTGEAAKAAVKTIDQAVKKGILHKNNAARKKSSIARRMNASAS